MNRRSVLVGMLACLALANCENRDKLSALAPAQLPDTSCSAVDEQNLGSAAKCYLLGEPADPWHFLSRTSQADFGDRATFITVRQGEGTTKPESLRVLGVDTKNGLSYGRVEVVRFTSTEPTKTKCRSVDTLSWVQEGKEWRAVQPSKLQELVGQQIRNGDYSGAVNTAETWLTADPFSIRAYSKLVLALERGGRGRTPSRSLGDTVRSALAVNPADSTALFMAVTHTANAKVAEVLFDRLSPDDCARNLAAANLSLKMSPQRRLAFLDKLQNKSAVLEEELVETLLNLGDESRLRSRLTTDADKRIRDVLDEQDGRFAAAKAVTMGKAWLLLKDKDAARAWASYAVTRDPNVFGIADLLRRSKS